MATTPTYKKLIKKAKDQRISTADELYDLLFDPEISEATPPITGSDYETAKKQLKLK